MKKAMIASGKCQGCAVCQVDILCENKVIIRETPDDRPWIDFYRCRGCMKCRQYCANGAIEELAQP